MFKKAKVLYYLTPDKSLNESVMLSTITELVEDSENVVIEPQFNSEDDTGNFFSNLIPGTIIAESLENKSLNGGSSFVFFCYPFNNLHFSYPLKPGEVVWFFQDEDASIEIQTTSIFNRINKYWVSRVCGTLISEDVNYSDFERNYLLVSSNIRKENVEYSGKTLAEKNNDAISKEVIDNTFTIPNYRKNSFFEEINPKITPTSKVYNKYRNLDFYPDAIPRYFSKPHELTLQGSNNSLINLTASNSNEGLIEIIAGRSSLEDYFVIEEESDDVIDLSNITGNSQEKLLLKKSFLKIRNEEGDLENFKGLNTYFNTQINRNINRENLNEKDMNASFILVSQDNDFIEQSYNIISDNFFKIQDEDTQLVFKDDNTKFDFEMSNIFKFNSDSNYEFSYIYDEVNLKPGILLKSNDIAIVARSKLEKDETDIIDNGSISLIKEDDNLLNESFIKLNNVGDIFLDGKTIYIGNFLKEIIKKNILSENDILFSEDSEIIEKIEKEKIDKLCGKGEGLIFGYDQKYSEPLVLGNSLTAILKDMIELNITLIDEVDKLSKALQTHIHVGIPASGVSGPMQDPSAFITYSNQSTTEMNNDLEKIRNNLKFMLSRFVKTS